VDALRRAWEDGDAVVPLDPRAPAAHRERLLARLRPTRLVDGDGVHPLAGGRGVEDGDALVMATSGTTGEPKGAVLTHRAVEAADRATATALGTDVGTVWLACLPLWHVGGLAVVTRGLHTGTGLVVHDGFDARAVQDAAAAGATHTSLVPTALARIDPAPWQRILLGGAAVPAVRPPNTVATYGMTETFGGIVHEGRPLDGVEVRIALDAPGTADGPGAGAAAGPIEVRAPSLLRAYRGPEADTAPPLDADGWLRTGDLGTVEQPGGRLVVQGRADELIITGGENVWPAPVEAVLEQHPAVAEAAVLGVADDEWGMRVCALVVPADPSAPPRLGDVRDWVRSRLPVAAAPRELRVVGTLPRTSLGKLARRTLADVMDAARAQGEVR